MSSTSLLFVRKDVAIKQCVERERRVLIFRKALNLMSARHARIRASGEHLFQ